MNWHFILPNKVSIKVTNVSLEISFYFILFLSSIVLLRNLLLESFSRTIARSRVWIRSSEFAHMFAVVFFLLYQRFDRTKTFNGIYAVGRNGCRYASKRISCRFYSFEFTVPGGYKPLRILRKIVNAFLLTTNIVAFLRKSICNFAAYFSTWTYKFTFVTSL